MKSMKLQKTWILAIVLVASVGLTVMADRAVEREGLPIVAELAGTKTQVKPTGGGGGTGPGELLEGRCYERSTQRFERTKGRKTTTWSVG